MMRSWLLLLLLVCLPALLVAQTDREVPSIGYVFPAGASRGDTLQVYVGGQKFWNVRQAHITGDGLEWKFVKRYPAMRNLNGDQRKVLNYRLEKRLAELEGREMRKKVINDYQGMGEEERKRGMKLNHPLFERIEEMDTMGIRSVRDFLSGMRKRQFTAAIAEIALFELAVAEDASLGERELRIETNRGLSNPLRFQVSRAIELTEKEPNGPKPDQAADAFEIGAPVVWNGQIMPGDLDRFRVKATEGERFTFEVFARRLIPYIADAVPGWFQPTLSIYDDRGTQLAFADDYLGSPDPKLHFVAPRDGEYMVEIRDSIYRGREDFVYRLFASHRPIKENAIRHADVSYEPSELPYGEEREPNSSMDEARLLNLSACVSGAIDEPGDADWVAFEGKAGSKVVAEVEARRFDSPLDSVVRLIDSEGKMIAYNDDYMLKRGHLHTGPGLQTHHADSYLTAQLPADGRYFIVIEDAQSSGSDAHKYRLRISQPEPQFEVRVEPSAVNFGPSACSAVHVWVNRKDGFEGEVEVILPEKLEGMHVDGGVIPAGKDDAWMTLRIDKPKKHRSKAIQLLASATVNNERVVKPVVATDNCMQAFLWRHLVPAQELRTFEWAGYKRMPFPQAEVSPSLEIASGGEATVEVPLKIWKQSEHYTFKLGAGPEGLHLDSSEYRDGRLLLRFSSDSAVDLKSVDGNLIIEAYFTPPPNEKNNKKRLKPQMLGVLPAIPFRIIES